MRPIWGVLLAGARAVLANPQFAKEFTQRYQLGRRESYNLGLGIYLQPCPRPFCGACDANQIFLLSLLSVCVDLFCR